MNEEWKLAQELTRKALQDFEFFARKCFHIKTKEGTVTTLELNEVQRDVLARVEEQIAKGIPVRTIILKARQMGMSTFIEAYLLWRMLRQGNVNALEIAHEKDAAAYILNINKFAVENLPAWFVAVTQIDTGLFNKNEVTFNHNNASLSISSADSKQPGRSRTLHYQHLSEVAFYPADRGPELVRAAFGSLPDNPGSIVFMESTGNGPAGLFYNYYTAAKNGLNDFIPLFYPWFKHSEYQKPVPDGVEVIVPPRLASFYEKGEVTREQLYWRQVTIANKFEGKEADFLAEYPEVEEDAWFQESANLFETAQIYDRLKNLPPYEEGFLVELDMDGGNTVRFQPADGDKLHIFKFPEQGKVYVVSADVGSGTTINRVGDGSSADVLDAVTGEQVAHLHVVAEPTLYAYDLKLLGTFYNMAMIAVEVTGGHGLSAVNWLRDNGYYNLYQRRVFDTISNAFTQRLGWDTTKSTRPHMINLLRSAMRTGEVIVNEDATLREMLTFIKNGDRYEAAPGAKDDRVLSLAIGNAVRKDASEYLVNQEAAPQEEEEKPLSFRARLLQRRNQQDFDIGS